MVERDGESLRDHPLIGDGLRELLLPFGKEPTDVRYVEATSDGGLSVGVFAVRIPGIDPEPLQAGLVGIFLFGYGPTDLIAIEPTTVDGRAVNLLTGGVVSVNGYTFTIGEVFFYVDVSPDAPVTIEDVLAELP